jgi:hypothetical protein
VANAGVIAYEGVQYGAGPLALNGPAFGFGGVWNADAGVQVAPGGLSSPLDLPSSGGSVTGFFNSMAPLAVPLLPTSNPDFSASVLIAHTGPNDQTYMGLSQTGIPLGNPPLVAFGVQLGQYGIFVSGAFTPCAIPFTPAGSTDFLAANFHSTGAAWAVSLFVNRAPIGAPDLVVNAPLSPFSAMANQNQAEFTSDEFRLGDTPGDVSAVPSPTAPALLAAAAVVVGRRRRTGAAAY